MKSASPFVQFMSGPDSFEALTPGRQRPYHLHFNQAKQSQTRSNRIAKWEANILKGKGMNDRYRCDTHRFPEPSSLH